MCCSGEAEEDIEDVSKNYVKNYTVKIGSLFIDTQLYFKVFVNLCR